ncbi:MAG TPA: hypothetical protein VNM67_00345 [Thermoanaerobaculia bacterium]|jgi:hypothetical protein|nr:hypothetical protein [Thermoanaerobaculia bacterium]
MNYSFHGLSLRVAAPDEVVRAFHARFASLPQNGDRPPDLLFEVRADPLERPERVRTVYEPPLGEVVYDDERDLLYLRQGSLSALCEPAAGRVRFSAPSLRGEEPGEDLWILSHPLLSVPMMELLKRRGLFGVHAAGADSDGRALVLAGTSGSGKSTLSVALARAGFGFLGDDTLFLNGRRILAFPDEIDLTEESVSFFPDLQLAPPPPGWRKRQLRADETRIVWESAPSLLVFPRVSGRPRSELRPIDPGEALLELAPNVLLTEPVSSQAHLDALAGLARASRCYRLETGTDLDEAVRLLRELM